MGLKRIPQRHREVIALLDVSRTREDRDSSYISENLGGAVFVYPDKRSYHVDMPNGAVVLYRYWLATNKWETDAGDQGTHNWEQVRWD